MHNSPPFRTRDCLRSKGLQGLFGSPMILVFGRETRTCCNRATWTHHSEHFWTMWASTQELKDGKTMENGVCRCLQNKDKGAIRYEEIRGNTRMAWNRSIIKVIKHLESLAKLFGFQAGHWVLAIWETAKGGFMKGFFGPGLSHCKWEWTKPVTQSSWV